MAVSFSGEVILKINGKLKDAPELGSTIYDLAKAFTIPFNNGVGANQANNLFIDQRTINNGANEDLDLSGVLTNPLGQTIVGTKIKGVVLFGGNAAGAAMSGNLTVTRPAANGVPLFAAGGDGFTLFPGGLFAYFAPTAAGVAITGGTGDLLFNLANASGAAQTYVVILILTT